MSHTEWLFEDALLERCLFSERPTQGWEAEGHQVVVKIGEICPLAEQLVEILKSLAVSFTNPRVSFESLGGTNASVH